MQVSELETVITVACMSRYRYYKPSARPRANEQSTGCIWREKGERSSEKQEIGQKARDHSSDEKRGSALTIKRYFGSSIFVPVHSIYRFVDLGPSTRVAFTEVDV